MLLTSNLFAGITVNRYINTASAAGGDGTTDSIGGANRAFSTLAEGEGVEDGVNHVGNDVYFICVGTGPDTAIVDFDASWTADSITVTGDNTTGIWDATKYRLITSGGFSSKCINIAYSSVTLKYIQAQNDASGSGANGLSAANGVTDIFIDSCIVKDNNAGTNSIYGGDSNTNIIMNCLVYGNAVNGIKIKNNGKVYNCTAYNNAATGIDYDSGGMTATNCVATDNGTDFDSNITMTYCMSSDATSAGTGSQDNIFSTNTFTNAVGGDFTVKDTNSPVYNTGTDLSGVGVTVDIANVSRPQFTIYDIGAFEFTSQNTTGFVLEDTQLNSLQFGWDVNAGVDSYILQASTYNGFVNIFTSSSTTDSANNFLIVNGLSINTTYFSRAGNVISGTTHWTETPVSIETATLSTAVTNVTATPALNSITYTWTPVSANGYSIQSSTASDFTGTVTSSQTSNTNISSLVVSGLDSETIYYGRVGSLNHSNIANYVSASSVTTLSPPPDDAVIQFVDLRAVHTTGGEGGNGSFLYIRGKNFGDTQSTSTVKINDIEVSTYKVWNDTEIVVQPGLVTAGAVVVNVNSIDSNTDITVAIKSTGSITIATDTDTIKAWHTNLQQGDELYIREMEIINNEVFGSGWRAIMKFDSFKSGTSTNPVLVAGYPDETVTLNPTGFDDGFDRAIILSDETNDYITISNIRISSNCIGISNTQDSGGADFLRVVNCLFEIDDVNIAGIQTGGSAKLLGNRFLNCNDDPAENQDHCIYMASGAGTPENYFEVAYNICYNFKGGHAIMTHTDNAARDDLFFYGNIHNNEIYADDRSWCRGMTVSEVSTGSAVNIYNNKIHSVGGGEWGAITIYGGTVTIVNNTIWDVDGGAINVNGQIQHGHQYIYSGSIKNNIIYSTHPYFAEVNGGSISSFTVTTNCYFGSGDEVTFDLDPINADPLFTDYNNDDVILKSNSPCKNVGLDLFSIAPIEYNGYERVAGSIDLGVYDDQLSTPQPTPSIIGQSIMGIQHKGYNTRGDMWLR